MNENVREMLMLRTVNCPNENCDGREAYYKQAQIRSADEPMTTFFRCVKCGHDWREG